MIRLKKCQIDIGYIHGEEKLKEVFKFPEIFNVISYAEENEHRIEKRG